MEFAPKLIQIGVTDWRNSNQIFGIKPRDRFGHLYVIGKTGVGKSTLLLNMAIADMHAGNGLAVLDPHGDLAAALLRYVPQNRIDDVLYFDPSDLAHPTPFNPLQNVPVEQRHLVASGLVGTFKRIWADSWGPRLEHILRFSILTLLAYGNATLLDIQPLLTDPAFRRVVVSAITDHDIRAFWLDEFERLTPQQRTEAIASILNKVGILRASQPMKRTFGHQEGSWTITDVMETGKILIANVSKGQLGEDVSSFLGSVLVHAIEVATLERAGHAEEDRVPFFLYLDEAHSFLSPSIAGLLAEARKFKLSLFMAHQYLEQFDASLRAAIFGNVGTLISFRVGAVDADYLAKEFFPVFKQDDLIALPKYHMYLKLMIDGATSKPFSAITLPIAKAASSEPALVRQQSAKRYGVSAKVSQRSYAKPSATKPEHTLFDEI